MKYDARRLAGSVTTAFAALALALGAIELIAVVLGLQPVDSLSVVLIVCGLLLALAASLLRRDWGVLLRFALLPINFTSGFLVLGAFSPALLGKQTPPGIAVVCTALVVACTYVSVKTQVKPRS